jgi:cytochrome c oxidase subunit 3
MGKVFMWLFLCQDALMFMGFFAAYISVRIGAGSLWPSPETHATGIEHYPLDIPLTAINTFVLICSSVSMVLAVQYAHWKDKAKTNLWLAATIVGGAIFLGVQYGEYYHLIVNDGMGMGKSLFDATFFSLTGFHGFHVFSGVMYLIALLIANAMGPKKYHDVGIVEWVFKILSLGLTAYFMIKLMGGWKDGGWFLKYGLMVPISLLISWWMPMTGTILFFWFGPFAGMPPVPHVMLSGVCGSLIYIMYRGVKWLRARTDMGDIVEVAGLYWHFVDLIWIILFTLVYLI